jgi:hypothetical protein
LFSTGDRKNKPLPLIDADLGGSENSFTAKAANGARVRNGQKSKGRNRTEGFGQSQDLKKIFQKIRRTHKECAGCVSGPEP